RICLRRGRARSSASEPGVAALTYRVSYPPRSVWLRAATHSLCGPISAGQSPGQFLVAGHADPPVDGQGLGRQDPGLFGVTGAAPVEEHPGVPPAGFGALNLERQLFGVTESASEVCLGGVPVVRGSGADPG